MPEKKNTKGKNSFQRSEELAERCKKPLKEEQKAFLLGEILNTAPQVVDSLTKVIVDKTCPVIFRCAALDRYVEIKKSHARELLSNIANIQEDHEDVRAVAFQWLQNPEVKFPTIGAVRMRDGEGIPEQEYWRIIAKEDPSPRVRWLATLGQ